MESVRAIDPALALSSIENLVTIRRDVDVAIWREGLRRAGLPQ
jgi:hypothetical protein